MVALAALDDLDLAPVTERHAPSAAVLRLASAALSAIAAGSRLHVVDEIEQVRPAVGRYRMVCLVEEPFESL